MNSDINRGIQVQLRLNIKEINMLDDLCSNYGLRRSEVIRRLIREDWETFEPPEDR